MCGVGSGGTFHWLVGSRGLQRLYSREILWNTRNGIDGSAVAYLTVQRLCVFISDKVA